MNSRKTLLLICLGLFVSACSTTNFATRNKPFEQLPTTEPTTPVGYEATNLQARVAGGNTAARSTEKILSAVPGESLVSVNSIIVRVPRTLKVSEANRYLPAGDIVWRGDPIGDRHLQVQKIFQAAMAKGVAPLTGKVRVDVDIQVRRFHAITEKARYTIGGLHSITFDLALKNPETGALLLPVRTVKADLDAFGGQQALIAESRGLTQKVRITNHLAEVIRQELSNPKGYENASLGFYQLLNNL